VDGRRTVDRVTTWTARVLVEAMLAEAAAR
jgi:hypothetical protein